MVGMDGRLLLRKLFLSDLGVACTFIICDLSSTSFGSFVAEARTSATSEVSHADPLLFPRMLSDIRRPSDRTFEIPFLMESASEDGLRACCGLVGGCELETLGVGAKGSVYISSSVANEGPASGVCLRYSHSWLL